MKKTRIAVAMLLVFALLTAQLAFADSKIIIPNDEAQFFGLVTDFVLDNYQFDMSKDELLERTFTTLLNNDPEALDKFLKALFNSLDAYSEFFSPQEWAYYLQRMENVTGGIGVQITKNGEYVEIIGVVEGSPAYEAGILVGDRIIAINGFNVVSQTAGNISILLSGDIGTEVSVRVLRGAEELEFGLVRYELKHESVEYHYIDSDAVYIYIGSFNMTTADEFGAIMQEVDAAGITKVLIDLRYNPGGYVDAAVAVASYFVTKGNITTLKFKGSTAQQSYNSELEESKYELVLLVNDNTASAAELFSSAVQDSGVGTIIGQQTYGKGVVQQFIPLYSGRVCKMTVGEYITRNGRSIQGVGVFPDIDVVNRMLGLSDTTVSKMEYKSQYIAGDSGTGVYACKQRLKALGYYVGAMDDVFSSEMKRAVNSFQHDTGLDATGILDVNTQIYLDNNSANVKVTIDKQLYTAFDILGINDAAVLRESIKN